MIDPNDVGLIIFDMDGTLVPSLPSTFEAVKRAFTRHGWPLTFGERDIEPFFGMTSSTSPGGFYEFITPDGCTLSRLELREVLYAEYPDTFRELAQPYPGAIETLTTLRGRGYRLALYTNASSHYLDMVMTATGLPGYFDHIECIEEHGLTKPELVRRIKERLGCPVAAVVGDRAQDVEAARETGSLAIGALYGYGGHEPEQADIAIRQFGELLDIFDRRLPRLVSSR
jgi:HAD superfamily hydrolase (TIGR01549 family)